MLKGMRKRGVGVAKEAHGVIGIKISVRIFVI